jgi:hypothetical protein
VFKQSIEVPDSEVSDELLRNPINALAIFGDQRPVNRIVAVAEVREIEPLIPCIEFRARLGNFFERGDIPLVCPVNQLTFRFARFKDQDDCFVSRSIDLQPIEVGIGGRAAHDDQQGCMDEIRPHSEVIVVTGLMSDTALVGLGQIDTPQPG